jgi:hypothetical protein
MSSSLRCRRVSERVKVPARWVTVRRHHKLVKVKRPARFTIKKVIECHPRPKVGRVAVRVRVRRHGREVWITRHKRERLVLPPHLENSTKLRVKHVKTALVTGWLGTSAGVALAGQPVTILTAPDNGFGQFTLPAATWRRGRRCSPAWHPALAPAPIPPAIPHPGCLGTSTGSATWSAARPNRAEPRAGESGIVFACVSGQLSGRCERA